jgi:murein DD-endopeptidase MepM/ murein hydrolase activator NlpD
MKPWGYIGITLLLAVLVGVLYLRMMKTFQWPVQGRLSSKFGTRIHPITGVESFHNGIDIAAPTGTPVYAPADGVVEGTSNTTKGGLQMVLRHNNGMKTGYAHLSKRIATLGDRVKRGDIIAEVGNTGASTGPHLHFTVTDTMGKKVDPLTYLA